MKPNPRRVVAAYMKRQGSYGFWTTFYKAKDGQWYVDYGDPGEDEDGEPIDDDVTSYGPFPSFDDAKNGVRRQLPISRGFHTDGSGRWDVPWRPVKPRGRQASTI